MATVVDQKIVQMKFDNKQFDDGIRDTMTLLEKFKLALGFTGATKGLEEIDNAAKKVDLSGLSAAANAVSSRFDAMQVVAITALANITNSAVNAGKQIVSSLTIDQVTSGFDKYEQKVQSVQTIMNATGKTIDEVSAELEKLIWFTDETSYSFTDMVNNVGKFTSNQIELETAVRAMMGIADAAGLAGASVTDASHAMDGFSKAIAVGYMNRQNWQWIQTAHMDTAEFKKQLMEAAYQAGTLNKVGEDLYETIGKKTTVSVADFETAMSEGWLTTEAMLRTLDEFGGYAEQVYKLYDAGMATSDAIEALSGALSDVGEKGFKASQEAKTFTDAINAVKDAVSSGWMQTFEYIFGNKDEAVSLWTDFTNELWEIFASGGERRNEILSEWYDWGGRDQLLESLAEAYENVKAIVSSIQGAFSEMFPPYTLETLQNLTIGFANLVKQLTPSQEALYTIYVVVKAILTPFRLLLTVIKNVANILGVLAIAAFKLGDAFLAMWAKGNPIVQLLQKIFGEERYSKLAESFSKILEKMGNFFTPIVDAVKQLIKGSDELSPLAKFLRSVLDTLGNIGNVILDVIVWGLEKISNIDLTPISNFFSNIVDFAKNGFTNVENVFSTISEFFSNIVSGSTGNKPVNLIEGISNAFSNLRTNFVNFIKSLGETKVAVTAGEWINRFTNFLKELGTALLAILERITPARILLYSFGVSMVALIYSISGAVKNFSTVLTSLAGMFDSFKGVMDSLAARIGTKASPLEEISKSILMLVASVVLLTMIDPAKLKQASLSLLSIAASLAIVFAAVSIFGSTGQMISGIKEFPDLVRSLSTTLVILSASIALVSGALFLLSNMNLQDMPVKLGILAAIIASISVVIFALTKMPKFDNDTIAMVASIASIAISLNLVVSTLNKMEITNWKAMIANLTGVTLVLIALKAVLANSYGIKFSNAMGVLVMILSLNVIANALKKLAKFDTTVLVMGVVNLIPVFVSLGVLCGILRVLGGQISSITNSILKIGLATLALAAVIKIVGGLSLTEIGKGLAVIAAVLVFFKVFNMVSSFIFTIDDSGLKDTFIGLGIAMLALSAAIAVLGTMDLEVILQGTIAVAAIIAMLSLVVAASKNAAKVTSTIIAITGAVIAMSAAVAILSLLEPEQAIVAVSSMAALLVALGATLKFIGSGQFSVKGMLNVLEIAGLFVILGFVFTKLSQTEIDNMTSTLVNFSGALLALSACVMILNEASGISKFSKGQLLVLAACITGLGFIGLGLSKLAEIANISNMQSVLSGIAGMTLVILSLSACFAALSVISSLPMTDEKKLLKIVGIMSLVGLLGTAITAGLSHLMRPDTSFESMLAATVGMSTVLKGLAVCLAIINGISILPTLSPSSLVKIGGMMVAMAVLGGVIVDAFNNMYIHDSQALLSTIAAMSAALIALSVTIGIMSAVAMVASKIDIASFGNFMLILAATITFGGLIAGLASDVDVTKIQNGAQVLLAIGEAIGGFVGGIIGGVIGGTAAGAIDLIGQSLANFVGVSEPFIDLMTSEKGDKLMSGIGSLVGAITALTADSLLSGLSRLLGGDTSLVKFGTQLTNFGSSFAEFAEKMDDTDVDVDKVNSMIDVATKVSDFAKDIPPQDSSTLRSWIMGDTSLASFGEGLSKFAKGISKMDEKAVNFSIPDSTIDSYKKLTKFASEIPGQGISLKTWLTGDTSLETFGKGIKSFANSIANFDEGALSFYISQDTVDSYSRLAKFASEIPAQPSGFDKWFGDGDTSLSKFGKELKEFGKQIANYYMQVEDIEDPTLLTACIEPLEEIIKLGTLDEISSFNMNIFTGLKTVLTEMASYPVDDIPDFRVLGINTLSNFIEGLRDVTLLNNIKTEFSNILSGINKIFTDNKTLNKIWGNDIVQNIINGINEKAIDAVTAVSDLCTAMAASAEATLDIGSPSKVFENIGKFITAGLTNGISGTAKDAVTAIATISNSIINSVRSIFQIHSPSVVMEEMGHYVVQGLAEGITSDMSAVEAAKQMADNIATAFKDGLDAISLDLSTLDLEQQLWEAMYGDDPRVTEEEINAKKMETLEKKMTLQAERVARAEAQYKAVAQAVGEETEEAQTAYNSYLQEMITLTGLAKEILGDQTVDVKDQKEAFKDYIEYMNQYKDFLLQSGFDMEQIEKAARDASGYLAGEEPGQNFKMVDELVNEYLQAVTVDLDTTVSEAIETAMQREVANGVKTGTAAGLSEGVSELGSIIEPYSFSVTEEFQGFFDNIVSGVSGEGGDIWTKLFNPEDFAGSIASMFDINLDLFNEKASGFINTIGDFGKNALNKFLSAWGIGDDGTSTEFENAGENAITGLENGITDSEQVVMDALDNVATNGLHTFRQNWSINSPSEEFKDIGIYAMAGLTVGFEEGSDTFLSALNTICHTIHTLLDKEMREAGANAGNALAVSLVGMKEEVFDAAYKLAEQLCKGMVKGINDNAKTVTDAADAVASSATQAMGKKLMIQSPSKVTEEMGMYFDMGFANGLTNYAGYAKEASENVGTEAVAGLNSAIREAAAMADEVLDGEPVIRPILDLDSLKKDMSQISGMFSTQQAIGIQAEISKRQSAGKIQNGVDSGSSDGTSFTFVQNNYSPKALTRSEIYRQTNNQFTAFKERVSLAK